MDKRHVLVSAVGCLCRPVSSESGILSAVVTYLYNDTFCLVCLASMMTMGSLATRGGRAHSDAHYFTLLAVYSPNLSCAYASRGHNPSSVGASVTPCAFIEVQRRTKGRLEMPGTVQGSVHDCFASMEHFRREINHVANTSTIMHSTGHRTDATTNDPRYVIPSSAQDGGM